MVLNELEKIDKLKFEDESDGECLELIFPGAARISYPLALMRECNTENTPMKKKNCPMYPVMDHLRDIFLKKK